MMKLNEHFLSRMREAAKLLQTSGPAEATKAIKAALAGEGAGRADDASEGLVDINPIPDKAAPSPSAEKHKTFPERFRGLPGMEAMDFSLRQPSQNTDAPEDAQASGQKAGGRFLSASCTNPAGTRAYKLYIPAAYRGEPLPLIVMLHGCKQNPDDFAAGTGMNLAADENNCFVAYPAQAQAANGSNCWNWFQPSDQQREKGEPSIIADITRQVMRDYRIDPERVYVAGLSAGAAMAAILAAAYPDLYAAVGIHSGLPVGSAQDVASAFGAMKEGSKTAKMGLYRQPVPAIVFHGDRDHTVHPNNGSRALAQSMETTASETAASGAARQTEVLKGKVTNGRAYTRTIFHGAGSKALAEHWVVHGAGHAWSGGSQRGSYTDPKGPKASEEMIRFFYAHPKSAV